jgi:hypothetical protein
MKKEIAATDIRAGVISSCILAICYLYINGLSTLPRVWAFMVLFAVCFVLMMKSVADLVVWAIGQVAAFSGRGLGKAFRLIRCL